MKLRLNWLPLGMKAETKGFYFVQVGTGVNSGLLHVEELQEIMTELHAVTNDN